MKQAGIIQEQYKTPGTLVQGNILSKKAPNSQTAQRDALAGNNHRQLNNMQAAKNAEHYLQEMRDPTKFKNAAPNQ